MKYILKKKECCISLYFHKLRNIGISPLNFEWKKEEYICVYKMRIYKRYIFSKNIYQYIF